MENVVKEEKVESDKVSRLLDGYVPDYKILREEIYTIATGEVHDSSWMYAKK